MPVDSRAIWTSRNTTQYFPKRVRPPKINWPYKPPPPSPKKLSTKELLQNMDALDDRAESWLSEAERLEARVQQLQRGGAKKQGAQEGGDGNDDDSPDRVAAKAAQFRKRAKMAKAAIDEKKRADELQMELKGEMSQKVDVQLGILLDKRRIKIGQVVGTWACIRIGELRKDEFRLQVQILGLDAPPAAIDAFFDSIDANRNGWLDVKEAGSAMKVLQEKAARARAQHDELVEEVKSLQLSAARKVMRALRPPPSSDKAVAFSDQEGAAGGSADELSDEADVLAVNADGSLAQRGETRSERKARDAERQKRVEDIAQKAMRRITQMALAKGWQTWQGWWGHRTWQLEQLRRGFIRIAHGDVVRVLERWREWHAQRVRTMGIMKTAMRGLKYKDLLRGWSGWSDYLDELERKRIVRQKAQRASVMFRNPMLVVLFDVWHQEQRLAAMARGDLHLAGRLAPWYSRLCDALRKCVQGAR